MSSTVLSIPLPEYTIDTKPDYMALGRKDKPDALLGIVKILRE